MQTGKLLKADGTKATITPANGKKFTLAELQNAVGGYIEIVRMKRGNGRGTMYINEEGKLQHLPYNEQATAIADISPIDAIVGDAIIVEGSAK